MSAPIQEDPLKQLERTTLFLQREAAEGVALLEQGQQSLESAKEAIEQNNIQLATLSYQAKTLRYRSEQLQNSLPAVRKTVGIAAGAFAACCYGAATHLSNDMLIVYTGAGAAVGWLTSSLAWGNNE